MPSLILEHTDKTDDRRKDEPFSLNRNLKENIERHLGRIRSKNNYGFHRLTFEKKDRIKNAEQTLKSHYADIQAHIEELKIRENKKMERAILVEKKIELKKFIKITPKGEIFQWRERDKIRMGF